MKTENPLPMFVRYPDFLVLVINLLVLRLGGQVMFTAQELADMTQEYSGVTVMQDFELEAVLLKIHTRKGK
jgi:hypothetical protein